MAKRDMKLEELILSRLSVISKVLGLSLIKDIQSREKQVGTLHVAGFTQREMADLLGIKYATVGVMLYNLRQSGAKKRAKKARKSRK